MNSSKKRALVAGLGALAFSPALIAQPVGGTEPSLTGNCYGMPCGQLDDLVSDKVEGTEAGLQAGCYVGVPCPVVLETAVEEKIASDLQKLDGLKVLSQSELLPSVVDKFVAYNMPDPTVLADKIAERRERAAKLEQMVELVDELRN